MKHLFLFLIAFTLFACGNTKRTKGGSEGSPAPPVDVVDEVEETAENAEEGGTITAQTVSVVGTVHVSDTGCPLYIDAVAAEQEVKLYPVNLEDKFKNEGMKLKFKYQPSKIQQPDSCPDAMPVTLSDVSLMR